ncbi:MAG TPA: class I SAM-dependent methyltransferase [Pyrinomonadaceae bacterium]|nr:class I SAM-dependent methyltransferase [Pyrinomonadaceae bacterium]
MNQDKAGTAYWEQLWAKDPVVSPHPSIAYRDRRIRSFLANIFKDFKGRGARLLEVGCGSTSSLPFVAGEFGFRLTGIDYSPKACEQARANLMRHGIAGEIVCADFLQPPENLKDSFDVVFSAGVVEHFTDTAESLRSLTGFLKDGGLMITTIPNLTGLGGLIQRTFNRPIFEVHVPLDRMALRTAHEQAGLEVVSCEYFMSSNFGMINLEGATSLFAKRIVLALLTRLSHAIWILEDLMRPISPNKFTSPYVICVARKRGKISSSQS